MTFWILIIYQTISANLRQLQLLEIIKRLIRNFREKKINLKSRLTIVKFHSKKTKICNLNLRITTILMSSLIQTNNLDLKKIQSN